MRVRCREQRVSARVLVVFRVDAVRRAADEILLDLVVAFEPTHVAGEADDVWRVQRGLGLIEGELQEGGIVYPSTSVIRGRTVLHVANTNHRSRRADFDLLVREVIRVGGELVVSG